MASVVFKSECKKNSVDQFQAIFGMKVWVTHIKFHFFFLFLFVARAWTKLYASLDRE